jgi:hypothetical protein
MKLSPFTIVYQPEAGEAGTGGKKGGSHKSAKSSSKAAKGAATKSQSAAHKSQGAGKGEGRKGSAKSAQKKAAQSIAKKLLSEQMTTITSAAPDIVKSLKSWNPNLSNMLVASSFPAESRGADEGKSIQSLRTVVEDLQRSKSVITVALWDLGAHVGLLSEVIDLLNQSQPVFTFFNLQAPVPAGLVIQAENFAAWARRRIGKKVDAKANQVFQNNLMSNDFYEYAQIVHRKLGVDYLAGITPYMVAGEEDGKLFWNHFSDSKKRIILTSAYDLREYASQAGRPFEVAVVGVVLAQLLAEINKRVEFHEDRGCIFDYNADRVSIVESLTKAEIEPECLNAIDAKHRPAVQNMLAALKSYSRADEALPTTAEPQDVDYWRKKLQQLTGQITRDR